MKKSFETPDDLEHKVTEYLILCKAEGEVPNKAGFCVFCQIHRDTYHEYKKNKPDFSDSIKRLESSIENAWVQRLAGKSPVGAIFYLKNAFKEDYKDRHETDFTSGGEKLNFPAVSEMTAQQIDDYLKSKITTPKGKGGK